MVEVFVQPTARTEPDRPRRWRGRRRPDSSGLAGLRERAEALGGMLELTSPPGRGTSVHVRLPAVAD